jgi:histidine triad (HIT) family protein
MASEPGPRSSGECDFCKIVRGEEPARVVGQTKETLAFFPRRPAALGHTLLIPKLHVPDIWSLDRSLASKITASVLGLSHALRNVLNPDGLNVINSSGEAASQTVFHLHVHLVPRWSHDHIGNIWPPSEPLPDEVKEEVADLVREAYASNES